MKLNIINVDEEIKKNKWKEVKSAAIYLKGKFHPEGLWSEEIFGPQLSEERRTKFAYIDLKCYVIHPQLYRILTKDNLLAKLLTCKSKFKFEDGKFVEENSGSCGPHFLYTVFDDIDWKSLNVPEEVRKVIKLYKKDQIFMNKQLVIPAGIRDIVKVGTSTRTIYPELNQLYMTLISLSQNTEESNCNEFSVNIQKVVNDIANWIKNKLKGKTGVLRGNLLKKNIDFSARGVIRSSPELNIDEIEIPWYVCLKIFIPFIVHKIMSERKDIIQILNASNVGDLMKILYKIADKQGKNIDSKTRQILYDLVKETCEGKIVTYKRDPVETRTNWVAGKVKVIDGTYIGVHPAVLPRMGGDIDGDTVAIFAALSKEAQKDAEKLLPSKSKTSWFSVKTYGQTIHPIELDAASIIYYATSQ